MSETQDKEFQVRNYAITSAAACLRETLGEKEANRIVETLSPRAREVISASRKPAEWSPVMVLSEVTRALAASSSGNADRAREVLISAGGFMGLEATNSFLRILMKMLSPELFAKKVPDLWKRDFTRGKIVIEELTDKKLVFRTFDMAGFDHAPCTAAGFVTFGLKTIGKAVDKTTVNGWSLDAPCADGASFEVAWTN